MLAVKFLLYMWPGCSKTIYTQMYVEAKRNDAKTAIPSPEFKFRIMSVLITGKGLC